MNKFSHLNIHSQYSISDGLVRLDELSSKAKDLNFESVAITDDSNLFGFVKFYKEMRDKGIKPICGVNFNSVKDISDNSEPGKLTLYAKNFEGYRNLTKLVSKSHLEGRIRSIPHLKLEWLKDLNEGLIFGAALDVFSNEPIEKDNPLLKNKKVILSPHSATFTDECTSRMSIETTKNIIDFFENRIDKSMVVKL